MKTGRYFAYYEWQVSACVTMRLLSLSLKKLTAFLMQSSLRALTDYAFPQISISPVKISFNTQQMLPYRGVRCSKAVFMTLT